MKQMRPIRLFFLVFFFMTAGFTPVSGETFNRVVALVNDEVITLYELNKRIKEMTGREASDLRSQGEERFLETRRQVLEVIIDERITRGKIQELGIKVTQKSIEGAIERVKSNNQWTQEDLLENLKQQGITYEEFQKNLKGEIERGRLINYEVKSKILITEEKIEQYYQKNMSDFGSEEKVHLSGLFLIREDPNDEKEARKLHEKGEEILSRLKKGADFGELARQFSQGPGTEEGGDLGTFKTAQLEPELRKICGSLSEGHVSDLIIRPNGIQIIKLISKQGGRVKSLDESRNAIHSILYKNEVDKSYLSWIKELRESSYTKIIF